MPADTSEIRELAHRYAVALDRRELDTLIDLFVPELRERLAPFFAESLGKLGVTILSVTTQVVDVVDDDHATGTVYCTAEIDDPDEGWIRQSIVYLDRYERRDGHWFFAHRDHQLVYGQQVRPNPLDQEPALWPTRPIGRGTYPPARGSDETVPESLT